MGIDIKKAVASIELVRETVSKLNVEYIATLKLRDQIAEEITRLEQASIPPSDMRSFLKDYIDVKASEYQKALLGALNELTYPNRCSGTFRFEKREPINFKELEALLKDGGEEILGSNFYANQSGNTKMLDLFSIQSNFEYGRAFCFYFGKQMKEALDDSSSFEFPNIPEDYVDPSTRAERRILIAELNNKLSANNATMFEIMSKMKDLGAVFNHDESFSFAGIRI